MNYFLPAVAFCLATSAHAVVLASWEVSDGIVSNEWASASNSANLNPAPWSPGAGTDGEWDSTASTIKFRFFSETSIGDSISVGDYFEFTITPQANVQYTVDSLNINGSIGNGDVALQLRSSVDSYATSLSEVIVENGDPIAVHTWTIAGTSHDNLTVPVSFRLYGYSVAPTGHTLNITALAGDDAWLEGSTSVVPEPGTTAFMIGLSGLTYLLLRRRR